MPEDFSRRSLIGGAAAGAVSAAAAGASALPAAGQAPAAGANDRVNVGLIGVGNRGTYHLKGLMQRAEEDNVRVAAVCDVFRYRLNRAAETSKANGYADYREVLARPEVDAVVISTPDHWHAKMAIDALEAGKHVYLEKPMTLTAEEAVAVRNKVRQTKLVLQVGPQWTGDDAFWRAMEVIRAGRLGKVTWAQSGITRNRRIDPFNRAPFVIEPSAGPEAAGEAHIDWDMWLGHQFGLAPKIPYHSDHYFRFRKYWPYSAGLAGDLLYHRLAPLLLALAGPDGELPLRVGCAGGLYVEKDGRDIPDVMLMTVDYPSEYSVFLATAHTNDTPVPTRIYGKYGTLDMNRARYFSLGGEPTLAADGEFGPEFRERNGGYIALGLPNLPRRDMMGNFIDVIRGHGTLYCNAELGAATMVAIAMGVEAFRQHKVLSWDQKAEKVMG